MSFGNNVYNTLNGNNGTSFTPAISFGGGNTGITYVTQTGYYQRIGNILYFTLEVKLSNKGSSTGAARITGLPALSNASVTSRIFVLSGYLDLPVDYYSIVMTPRSDVQEGGLALGGDNLDNILLTDAEFTNDTRLIATGFYFV